jgi:type II secretory pathway pseudopilin PulG
MRSIKNSRGFSLTELMVSMTLFMVISGTIWGALISANKGKIATSEKTMVSKNVRVALNVAGRDTFNAGYGYPLRNTVVLTDNRISAVLGIPNDVDTTRDTVPPIIAGDELNTNTFSTTPNTKTDQVTFLFKDSTFNILPAGNPNGASTPLDVNAATTTSTSIDEIIPISGSNAGCRVNDLFLVTGNTGSVLAVATGLNGTSAIQFANGDVLNFNLTGTTGPLRGITVPASIMRVRMVTYYVTTDGILMRREYANAPAASLTNGYMEEPIVYGVEDLNIQYVMDNGALSDNPAAGPDGIAGNADDVQANLAAIRQVRFTINVRSVDLDASGQPFRNTLTSTFSTRNLGYDAN